MRASDLVQECQHLRATLEEQRREAEVLVELAKNEAVRPIKEQLRDVFQEAELLQKRFAHDLHQRDMQWEQMFEQGSRKRFPTNSKRWFENFA